jgi:hypothetical protein
MIELEIQALSERREGLLIEVGRSVVASGFILQRQRLAQDANGVLLTMVVRGPARKQRALEAALEAHERVISFNASEFVEGVPKPHFAASTAIAREVVVATPVPTTPQVAPVAAPVVKRPQPIEPEPVALPVVSSEPEPQPQLQPEPEPEFIFVLPRAPAPAPVPAPAPYVDSIPVGPNVEAVEKVLPELTYEYPQIFPWLLKLESAVAENARESSLWLAGQRTGTWVFKRDYAVGAKLALHEAIERVGVPALGALVEVEQKGDQLHIRNSPLCTADGQSGCKFFGGYLEGLLGPAISSGEISIFAVCCRSCGADECVLAVMD